MASGVLSADLVLRGAGAGPVGAERIRLLRAIAATGSISAAARSVGLSYKGAWDAVQVMNNLFERPVVTARPGGKRGGAASVTDEGAALISAFEAIEGELAAVMNRVSERVSGDGLPLRTLLWSLGMKTSARNALRGVVDRVIAGAVNSEVVLNIGETAKIVAIITRGSVDDLGLEPGRPAIALIKSSFVILARDEGNLRTSARNKLAGVITHIERGAVNDVVTLDIGAGKSVTATVTRESTEELELAPRQPITALIKASHVILAVE